MKSIGVVYLPFLNCVYTLLIDSRASLLKLDGDTILAIVSASTNTV